MVVSSLLVGCASDEPIEDGEDDAFMTPDAKADAFGVEDWSPDGAAVLRFVTNATASKLEDEVGLSARVAKAIIVQRSALRDKEYIDLADLDAAKYVGPTVFKRLLQYAADNHLFKTSLRIPLLVEDETGDHKALLASYNDKARTAGVAGFARYTFVDSTANYIEKADAYDLRLQEIATKSHVAIVMTVARYMGGLKDVAIGSAKVCFIGDPTQVGEVAQAQGSTLLGDMYSVYGWRYRNDDWTDENIDNPTEAFGSAWTNYAKSSAFVRVLYSNDDGGDTILHDDVPPCR